MNIHPYAGFPKPNRAGRFWSREEDKQIRTLSDAGITRAEIARQLADIFDRTEYQITQRLIFLRPNVQFVPPVTIQIHKSRLVDYYTAGWKVASFDGDVVTMEWPYERHPVAPVGAA